MKRYSKNEIKKAFETQTHLPVEGFVSTASVLIDNTEYNQNIIDSGEHYGELTCTTYGQDKQINSYLPWPLKNFIRVYR